MGLIHVRLALLVDFSLVFTCISISSLRTSAPTFKYPSIIVHIHQYTVNPNEVDMDEQPTD